MAPLSPIHLLLLFSTILAPIIAKPSHPARSAAARTVPTAVTITLVSAIPEPTGNLDISYTNYTVFIKAALGTTNLYRYEHDAPMVTWNESMAAWAADYASQCAGFKHSGRDGVGENIVLGASTVEAGIEAFGNERKDYNFHDPGFSEQTGHFTQLVWKATTSTGCGAAWCDNDDMQGVFMVCQYFPPGNVGWYGSDPEKLYVENVTPQVNDGQGYRPEQVVVDYQVSGTTSVVTATNTIGPAPTGANMIGSASPMHEQPDGRWWWAMVVTTAALALAGGMM